MHIDPKKATRTVILIGMLMAVALELRAVTLSLFGMVVAAWVGLPFYLLYVAAKSERSRASAWLFCAAAALMTWVSFMAYRPSSANSSSTAGLVFLFLPLWQLIVVATVSWIGGQLDKRFAARS